MKYIQLSIEQLLLYWAMIRFVYSKQRKEQCGLQKER